VIGFFVNFNSQPPVQVEPAKPSPTQTLIKMLNTKMGPTKDIFDSMEALINTEWITCPKPIPPFAIKDYEVNWNSAQLFLDHVSTIQRDNSNNPQQFYFHIPTNPFLVLMLTKAQYDNKITGAAGEIGVHYGGFFLAIATAADVVENLFVIDVFDLVAYNVDGSGAGRQDMVLENADKVSIRRDRIAIIKEASTNVTTANFTKVGPVRFFSVDGGHTAKTTFHDLVLASCVLVEGGIIALDDVAFPDTWSQGVVEGLFRFLSYSKRLVPFLASGEKLYLTTSKEYAQIYTDYLLARFKLRDGSPLSDHRSGWHISRRELFGFPILQGTVRTADTSHHDHIIDSWRNFLRSIIKEHLMKEKQ